ncbi:MAG: SH3 domain-containing protein [Chitinophagales bacterium]|nr:SH3 domain-containing protein [Chitinophagales bacterium]
MRFLFFLLTLIPSLSHAQPFMDEYMVISSALNLRENPDIKSKSLIQIPNGAIVQTVDNQNEWHDDQIDELYGHWIKVRYKQFTGYAFSAYLGAKYMLYFENAHIHYMPKVKYWYGVYYDTQQKQEVIRKIKTRLSEVPYEESGEKKQFLSTDQKNKSLFLIATNELISEKNMGVFKFRNKSEDSGVSLLPGKDLWLYFKVNGSNVDSETYHLFATGAYSMSEYGLRLYDFELYVADNNPPDSRFTVIQNLNKDIGGNYFEGAYLFYCGDIDGDGKPDIILNTCSNSHCTYILLLSSSAKPGELLRAVSTYTFYDDC